MPGTRQGEGKVVRTLDSGFILKKKLEQIKFPDGLYRTCERKRHIGVPLRFIAQTRRKMEFFTKTFTNL